MLQKQLLAANVIQTGTSIIITFVITIMISLSSSSPPAMGGPTIEAAPRNIVRRPKAEVSFSKPRRSTSTMLRRNLKLMVGLKMMWRMGMRMRKADRMRRTVRVKTLISFQDQAVRAAKF